MIKAQINTLLDLVHLISKKHEEIGKITGRNFNVFRILDLTTSEVRLHSNFIAELLNPKGNHGQGTLYLDLFIKLLNETKKYNSRQETHNTEEAEIELNTQTTKVHIEYHIGNKTEEVGGIIDILCEDRNKNRIIIENKIYATDQQNQLLRYYNFDKKAHLIYLTLFGIEPSSISTGKLSLEQINPYLLSYENDISRWLEWCIKESYQLPVIRETLLQYLLTIKRLTHQLENKAMDNEITTLLTSSGDKITSAIIIEKSVKEAKLKLMKIFGEKLKAVLNDLYKEKGIVELDDNFGEKYNGIYVSIKLNKKIYFQLSFINQLSDFYLEVYNDDNIVDGVISKKSEDNLKYYKENLNNICNSLGKIENVTSNWHGDWVCRYSKLERYFTDDKGWGDIADSNFEIIDSVVNDISPIIDAMLKRYA